MPDNYQFKTLEKLLAEDPNNPDLSVLAEAIAEVADEHRPNSSFYDIGLEEWDEPEFEHYDGLVQISISYPLGKYPLEDVDAQGLPRLLDVVLDRQPEAEYSFGEEWHYDNTVEVPLTREEAIEHWRKTPKDQRDFPSTRVNSDRKPIPPEKYIEACYTEVEVYDIGLFEAPLILAALITHMQNPRAAEDKLSADADGMQASPA